MPPVIKSIAISAPLCTDLYSALPEELQTREVAAALDAAYQFELKMLLTFALSPSCVEPLVAMYPWRQAGAQWIAEFHVSDMSRKSAPDYNWHGQNTSQWCYAGAIVIEDGRVTQHH